jgi:hypothetical protein
MKNESDPFDLFSCADLDRDKIRQLAFETGFCKRASGKINAPDFLIHLCLQSVAGTVPRRYSRVTHPCLAKVTQAENAVFETISGDRLSIIHAAGVQGGAGGNAGKKRRQGGWLLC